MRMRTILPLLGLLVLAACHDDTKAASINRTNPPATTGSMAPINPTPANPAPDSKPAAH